MKTTHKFSFKSLIAGAAAILSSASMSFAATQPSVDGTDFTGWNKVGQSDSVGTYAKGSTTEVYEIYSVVFEYDTANPIPGTPTGFNNGDKIVGIGVKRISGVANYPILKLDPSNDSYAPATSIAEANGKTSFGTYGTWGETRLYISRPA